MAACLPDPATLGDRMHGTTCAGLWVTGTGKDGQPREVYLHHVVDNAWSMAEYGSQCVVWQTAVNPVVALELLADGTWSGAGVLGPEAFDPVPFLDRLGRLGPAWGLDERTPARARQDEPLTAPAGEHGGTHDDDVEQHRDGERADVPERHRERRIAGRHPRARARRAGRRPDRPVHRRPVASGHRRRHGEVDDPSTREVLAEVADATVDDGRAALDAAVAAQASWAATPPRDRGEILRRAFELITARADDLALLMTLEMGKPVKESKAEIAYAAEFFRWFSEEAVRISGRWSVAPNGASPAADDEAAGRPLPVHHALELPAGHGHPQDRAGDRRGLHDGRQAGDADPAVDVRARADPDRGRAARRRAQRDHDARPPARSWSR